MYISPPNQKPAQNVDLPHLHILKLDTQYLTLSVSESVLSNLISHSRSASIAGFFLYLSFPNLFYHTLITLNRQLINQLIIGWLFDGF